MTSNMALHTMNRKNQVAGRSGLWLIEICGCMNFIKINPGALREELWEMLGEDLQEMIKEDL